MFTGVIAEGGGVTRVGPAFFGAAHFPGVGGSDTGVVEVGVVVPMYTRTFSLVMLVDS